MGASDVLKNAMSDLMESELALDALFFPAGETPYLIRVLRTIPDEYGSSVLSGAKVEGCYIRALAGSLTRRPAKGDKLALTFPAESGWSDPVFWASDAAADVRSATPTKTGLFIDININRAIS